MNCEFCYQELFFSHYENGFHANKVYDCSNCPVLTSFCFTQENFIKTKTIFVIDRKKHLYTWTNNYLNNTSYIFDIEASLASFEKDPCIIRFPKIMNINPNNVYEKFIFYMTWL